MGLRIALGVLALVVGALGFKVFDQGSRIAALERELQALRSKPSERRDLSSRELALPPHFAQPRTIPIVPSAPSSAPIEQPAPAPRVPVTQAEIDHVESAVLSLLEADRPELREKLRGVVQEQQRTLEQQQREERRERWATRREARLLEVGKEVGLSAEQQQAILHIMLATRDQIGDMRQSAQTPDAINSVRDRARAIREQSEAQIRELMSPQQYQTFSERFGDDDDDERRGPPRRP